MTIDFEGLTIDDLFALHTKLSAVLTEIAKKMGLMSDCGDCIRSMITRSLEHVGLTHR